MAKPTLVPYEIHKSAELFPEMDDKSFQELKTDISLNGQQEAIVLWKNKIVDGRHRYRALCELGWDSSDIETWELDPEDNPYNHVISANLHRRHLTASERARIAAKLSTKAVGSNQHTDEGVSKDTPSIQESADQLNVGRASVCRAKSVIERGSDALNEAVDSKVISNSMAEKLLKHAPTKAAQTSLVNKGPEAVRDFVRKSEDEANRHKDAKIRAETATVTNTDDGEHEATDAAENPQLINSKYCKDMVIAIDAALELIRKFKSPSTEFGEIERRKKRIRSDLENAKSAIVTYTPHATCPACEGADIELCKTCDSRGWLNKRHYNEYHRKAVKA